MKLYNTLSRQLEEFKPISDHNVLFYHCGPTVYWVQHIGNLRAMVWADLIRRSFIYLGYHVKFVRNYTDVGHLTSDEDQGEDKMEKGAKREGLSPQAIANKYIKIFEEDTLALNILEPDKKPKASEYIKEMQEMIKILIDRGYAYITNLAVVYDVSKFPNYNKLNHQNLELNKQGAGKGMVDDPEKKHFADFNLWVFKKGVHENAIQTWDSPWGEGFPGWHIECSVMAKSLLSETIDVHMGGVEHISVHHTNEIAQSEATSGKPFVHYWLHNEHLDVNNEKMAKSKGTGFTLKEIKDHGFDPIDLRYFFLTAHYRSKQNFTFVALKGAKESLNNLKRIILELKEKSNQDNKTNNDEIDKYLNKFKNAISNDFEIPQGLAILWEVVKSDLTPNDKLKLINEFDKVLGLKLDDIKKEEIPQEIIDLAKERKQEKVNKNFKKADEIRNQINKLGYSIEDTEQGYKIMKN